MAVKARIVIAPDGNSIGVFVEEGTFDEAADHIRRLYAALGQSGVTIVNASEPESHRHDTLKVEIAQASHR